MTRAHDPSAAGGTVLHTHTEPMAHAMPTARRHRATLTTMSARYPDLWQQVDQIRAYQGVRYPSWPD